ncbi:hypothetical protein IOD16_15595 [Saccharothrix sp. 6-C]|uniref:hypothetical protein n=1 Tax=Saccharothrix sp. 6-C TaxID=2781735 RepID=UPI0019179838|nr:hypothetical protein IOD16_15595 [Saccharothrix sp. 6-C]
MEPDPPDRRRAVAESVKTPAWRYAVAGTPFPAAVARPAVSFRDRAGRVDGESQV